MIADPAFLGHLLDRPQEWREKIGIGLLVAVSLFDRQWKWVAGAAGVDDDSFELVCDRVILCPDGHNVPGVGDLRKTALRLCVPSDKDPFPGLVGRRVLLLGDEVAEAFHCREIPPAVWRSYDGRRTYVALLPDKPYRGEAKQFLKKELGWALRGVI